MEEPNGKNNPRLPDIQVKRCGEDDNAFIIGLVSRPLWRGRIEG